MFGSFLPEPWFGFGTTKSTQVAGADIVMKSPVRCLNIVWMVVSPCSSHSLTPFVIWHNVVVIRELFLANWADSILLSNLSIEQLSHLRR
jgi:hypothetical protein